jgi:hypothetical protein
MRALKAIKDSLIYLRGLLQRNKIFFEVITAGVLSVTAIIVSVQANKIAETQTIIMKEEVLPQIEILMTQTKDSVTNMYDTYWLVYNRGGKMSEYKMDTYTFIKPTLTKSMKIDSLMYPLYGYTDLRSELTGSADDLVSTFNNGKNAFKEQELRNSLNGEAYFSIETYASVTYTDILGHKHYEYYLLGINNTRLSHDQWKKIEEHHNYSKRQVGFNDLNKELILDLANPKN